MRRNTAYGFNVEDLAAYQSNLAMCYANAGYFLVVDAASHAIILK